VTRRKLLAGAVASAACLSGADAKNRVPRPAPDFAFQLANGSTGSLQQHRGKVVCAQFLLTTCPHCQHASELLSRLQKEYGPRGFQPIGIAYNPMSKMLIDDYVRDHKVTFPVGAAEREPAIDFLGYSQEERVSVPQIVFIDRKGIIRYQSQQLNDAEAATEQNLRFWIEKLLAEPAGASRPSSRPASKTGKR
jgi:peroxiredoxin